MKNVRIEFQHLRAERPRILQRLHAYWRMPYILAPKNPEDKGNPFVHIHQAGDDKAHYILYRGQWNYIVMNRYPYNAGHLLALPYREAAGLEDSPPRNATNSWI